jgi:hypothetical protein
MPLISTEIGWKHVEKKRRRRTEGGEREREREREDMPYLK